MDQLLNIYANVERPPGNASTRKREIQSSENIYENVLIHALEPNRTGPALSGVNNVKKSSCRAAAVCLGLLCLLLLTGLIILVFMYTKSKSEWEMETASLNNGCNNLMNKRDQLQTSYNHLISEKHQLENSLTSQKEQLETRYSQLASEKDQLQERLDALIKEKKDLQRKLQAKTGQPAGVSGRLEKDQGGHSQQRQIPFMNGDKRQGPHDQNPILRSRDNN